MPWDSRPHGGFTSGTPWLPLDPDPARVNVAAARKDPPSLLTLYRRLLALRRERPALAVGACEAVSARGDVLTYVRRDGRQACLVALNLGRRPRTLEAGAGATGGRILLSTHLDRTGEPVGAAIALRSDEGLLIGPS